MPLPNLDVAGFAQLLGTLLNTAWGEGWGTFTGERPSGPEPVADPLPLISWDVAIRRPSELMKAARQRQFSTEPDPDLPDEYLAVYRQWFDSEVEFTVWAPTAQEVRTLTGRLDELLLACAGQFKEQGVSEIAFLSERRDQPEDTDPPGLVHRTLTYLVRTERVSRIRTYVLRNVIVKAAAASPDPALQSPTITVEV